MRKRSIEMETLFQTEDRWRLGAIERARA